MSSNKRSYCCRISILVYAFFFLRICRRLRAAVPLPWGPIQLCSSVTILSLTLMARGSSFHSSPVCWWPRWPRRGPGRNITFAVIRPSFALRLYCSLVFGARSPSISSFSFFSSTTASLFLIFFLGATERNEKIRQDPYLRHRDTCHGAKSFDSVSCCMLYFISTLIGRCPLKNIFRGIFQNFCATRQVYNHLLKIICIIKVIREKVKVKSMFRYFSFIPQRGSHRLEAKRAEKDGQMYSSSQRKEKKRKRFNAATRITLCEWASRFVACIHVFWYSFWVLCARRARFCHDARFVR